MQSKDLIGKKIVNVMRVAPEEMDDLGWYGRDATKIVLDSGAVIFASSDEEGNDSGSFYVFGPNGEFLLL